MYETIIFDFFGVIFADPLKLWADQHGFDKRTGVIGDTARGLDIGELSYDEYISRLAVFSGEQPAVLRAEFQSTTLLDSDVVSIIDSLHRTYQTGLLSNTSLEEVGPLFAMHDLEKHFDAIVISAETGMAKPDAKIYDFALHQLQAEAAKTVFIDDNGDNVVAADAVGLHAIRFTSARQLAHDLTVLGLLTKK